MKNDVRLLVVVAIYLFTLLFLLLIYMKLKKMAEQPPHGYTQSRLTHVLFFFFIYLFSVFFLFLLDLKLK